MHSVRFLIFSFLIMYSTLLAAMSDIKPSEKISLRPDLSEQRKSIEESAEIIKQVKGDSPFVNIVEEKVWNFEKEPDEESESGTDLLWVAELFRLLAIVIEAALWLLPLVILFYIYRYRDYWINLVQGNGFAAKEKALPDTLFGLDISQQSLPDDVPGEAAMLWKSGEYRNALSLLYRASLAAVFRKYTFELPPGATEQDCLREVERCSKTMDDSDMSFTASHSSINLIEHFKLLTDLWIQLAYAHNRPDDERFFTLCDQWNTLYDDKGSDS